uniref:BED-type domain-containing protein n=1 Tax=Chenopodium quinoa TaxID=63459 RepID=A0A803LUS7_CHEQI
MTTNVGGVPDQPQSEHETDQVSQNQKKEQGAKRKRMKERSEVWEHFDKEDLPSGMQAICKYCGMSYKCGAKKNGTSVLWDHISRCRKYPFNTPKDSKQSLLSFKSAKEPSGGTSGLTYHKFDAGSIRKALSFMVIVDELPFKFVEVDNASSNDTAIGYMRRKINGWKTGVLKGRFLHMRCVAHIVNLFVSDGLKTVNESVQRVRHAFRFIKQSPARLQRFKKCVLDEKINTKKGLCLDVPTRWNSTYLMLNAAIELQDAFERYSGEDPHYVVDLNERDGKGSPDSDDWNNVRRLSEFLQAFYDLTLHVSGSLYVSLNLFFHELVSVAVLMKDLVSSDDVDMCLMACRMKEKYEKYWGDPEKINLLIFIVVVLDPRYKLDYVEWMITEIYDPIVASKLVDNVKVALNALYEEYRVSSGNDVNREEVSSSKDGKTPLIPKHKKIEVLKSKYKKHKCERDGDAKIELDKYLEEDTAEDIDEFDILSWWKFNCSRFPTVGRIARDVLVVPVSTVASESAFSTGGRVLDQFRSSLTPRVVEGLVCAQNWLRASPFPSIEECLEEVELLEEVIVVVPVVKVVVVVVIVVDALVGVVAVAVVGVVVVVVAVVVAAPVVVAVVVAAPVVVAAVAV